MSACMCVYWLYTVCSCFNACQLLITFTDIYIIGLFDYVISDYLWARAIILTSPVVATVGLSITIPFAFVADIVLNGYTAITIDSIIGSILVMIGFVLVNRSYIEVPEENILGLGSKGAYTEGDVEDVFPSVGDTLSHLHSQERGSGGDMRISIVSAEL